MAKTPRPWFRRQRKAWFVCFAGVQYNLGKTRKEAYDAYARRCVSRPAARSRPTRCRPSPSTPFSTGSRSNGPRIPTSGTAIAWRDSSSADADLRVGDLRPLHAQQWVDSYPGLMRNSRCNHPLRGEMLLRLGPQAGLHRRAFAPQPRTPGPGPGRGAHHPG